MSSPTSAKSTSAAEIRRRAGSWANALTIGLLIAVAALVVTTVLLAAKLNSGQRELEALRKLAAQHEESARQVPELLDRLNNAVQDFKRLEKQNQDLVAELSKAQKVLKYHNIDYRAGFTGKRPPAGLTGEVTAVRSDMIEISVGSDDGVRKGHKLEMARVGTENKYVGRLEVLETAPDRAVCRIDKKMVQTTIQKGDRVVADLSQVH